MKTAGRKNLSHNNFDTSFVKIDQVLIILWRLKGEKVPNSIVAVNHIEIINHIDWLHNDLPMCRNKQVVINIFSLINM